MHGQRENMTRGEMREQIADDDGDNRMVSRREDTTEELLRQTRRHVRVCQDSRYYLISINVKQRWRFPISFLSKHRRVSFLSLSLSFSLPPPPSSLSPSLYLYPVQLYVWLGTGVENRSRLKRGRAHLHDMNIMERAGSPANSALRENATCWTKSPGITGDPQDVLGVVGRLVVGY